MYYQPLGLWLERTAKPPRGYKFRLFLFDIGFTIYFRVPIAGKETTKIIGSLNSGMRSSFGKKGK